MVRIAVLAVLCLCAQAMGQSNNAAGGYKEAFKALGFAPYGNPEAGLLSTEDRNFIGDLGFALTQGDRVRLDTIMLKVKPALAQLEEASRARKCDWDLDRTQGVDLLLPHLSTMRNAARLLRAQALLATTDGDRGAALLALGSLGRLSAHSGQDKIAISSLVGSAVGSLFTNYTNLAIESGAIDQKNAQQLIDAVGALKRADPYNYADAMRGEHGLMVAEFAKQRSPDELAALLGDRKLSDREREDLASPDKVQAMLRQAKGLYERAAAAMENPDPIAARREIREIEAMVESGRGGVLMQVFMPAIGKMYEAKLRSEQELTILLERLQNIADGKVSEAELLNAAVLLHRAAANASATSADTQDAFELVRVSPNALDPLALERAAALLERSRPSVTDILTQAAALKRCDFSVLRLPEPSLDVRLLGGLRAATRIALADGLHQARTAKNASAAAPGIATACRVATLLSSDPTLARAHVAQSIWNEAATALQEALGIGPLSDVATSQIERALATMPAPDPFGWRKAFEAEIKRLVLHATKRQSGALTPEVLEMRERVLRQRGATAALARVAMIVAGRGLDDTLPSAEAPALERLIDLWPARATTAAIAAHEAARAANEAAGKSALDVGIFDVPLDLPLEEQRSLLRKHDPVRGVVFIDVPATQSEGTAVYVRPFDLLKKPPASG